MKKPPPPLTAYLPFLGALALAAAAAYLRLSGLDPLPAAEQAALDPRQNAEAVVLYQKALRLDNANPYRWADYAEALANIGQTTKARLAFARALDLGPHIPAVRLRLVNFLLLNDPPAALPHAAKVLEAVPDYDPILFRFLDTAISPPSRILDAIGGQPRALRSWLLHLIATNQPAAAQLAWQRLLAQKLATPDHASAYVDYLLRQQQFAAASQSWAAFVGRASGDYPSRNLIFNAPFSLYTGSPYTGVPSIATQPRQPSHGSGPLDWHFAPESEDFLVTYEPGLLKIRFEGKTNVNAELAWQTVVLPHPGAYRLSASVSTDQITTNEGLRLAIQDLGLVSESIIGSVAATPIHLSFSVPAPRTVRIAVVRRPSEKFDNKIEGAALVRDLLLISLGSPSGPYHSPRSRGAK